MSEFWNLNLKILGVMRLWILFLFLVDNETCHWERKKLLFPLTGGDASTGSLFSPSENKIGLLILGMSQCLISTNLSEMHFWLPIPYWPFLSFLLRWSGETVCKEFGLIAGKWWMSSLPNVFLDTVRKPKDTAGLLAVTLVISMCFGD